MGSSAIGAEPLHINYDADAAHTRGLTAELAGNFGEADILFATALRGIEDDPRTLDAQLQVAHIGRDRGFSYVRAGIGSNDVAQLKAGADTIRRYSAGFFDAFDEQRSTLTKEVRREASAEYGATVDLIARTATASQVMYTDIDSPSARIREADRTARAGYKQAHRLLKEGDNGYYRVSNAMNAARHERINSSMIKVAAWTGRAAVGLAWTATHDRKNLINALRTTGNRARHLLTKGAATRSVKTAP